VVDRVTLDAIAIRRARRQIGAMFEDVLNAWRDSAAMLNGANH
jgi:hypothetical protein